MICEVIKAPNDPAYFIRQKATFRLLLAVKLVCQLKPLKAMELHCSYSWQGGQLGYWNSPICYQFDPVRLRGVQSENEVAGALAS